MGKKIIKEGYCPKCKKFLIRKIKMSSKENKSTTCERCKFIIQNSYEIFKPRTIIPQVSPVDIT